MERSAKEQWREEILKDFDGSQAVFFAHYSGMTVEELSALRRELRKANATFRVVKNTIAKKAIAGRKEEVIKGFLKGQTGAVFVKGDVAAAAKTLSENAKKNEKFIVTGGYMEAASLSAKSIEQLASLPPREVLIAKILGSLVSPHRQMLGVLQGVPRAMVSVLNQIKETKAG